MKYIIKYLFVALLSIATITSCKESSKEKKENINLPAKLQTTSLSIEGMTCEIGCAKTIEAKIGKIEGVKESNVDFDNKKGDFTYNANVISEAKIVEAINELLDGKTYTANVNKKCNRKVGEDCKKSCSGDKKTCSKGSVKVCDSKEKKGCCSKSEAEKKECKKSCSEKKEGDKVCSGKDQKSCCDKSSDKNESSKDNCEKPCCSK